ncbi:hypothetical protein [Ereboglobus luteus]|uniref:Uncharacterized protein n=1 Tax=Ereboglobus luteus TaxID=1796921 RepID=A0A2U8E507_9BACT|nr:hypothetical protein [Ereboglobus luteus]AWI10019.1 hypothetical protein CKA38_12835 [Ereboglobus luteus]
MANIPSLKDHWLDSCKEFESMTLQKKPVESVKKCWLRSNKTLTVTLAEFDTARVSMERDLTDFSNGKVSRKKLAEDLNKLAKRNASLKKMAKAHVEGLEDDIMSELLRVSKTDASGKSVYEKGLKFLKKEIDALLQVADANYASAAYSFAHLGEQIDALQRSAVLFEKQMTANIAKGAAVAAKLKAAAMAAKTPKDIAAVVTAYNSQIVQNAGRDINVLTVGLQKYCKKVNAPSQIADPVDAFYNFTKPWNEPATHKLTDNATAAQVLGKLKEFTEMLKKAAVFAPRVLHNI